jgi:hypothetical protein
LFPDRETQVIIQGEQVMASFRDTLRKSPLNSTSSVISVLAIAKAANLSPPVSMNALIKQLQALTPPFIPNLPPSGVGPEPNKSATVKLALNVGGFAIQNRGVTLKSVEWTLTEVDGANSDKVSGITGSNRATATHTRQFEKAGKWKIQAKVEFDFQPATPAPPGGSGQPPARTSRTVAGPTDPQPVVLGPGTNITKGFLLELLSSPNDPTDIFTIDEGVA